MEKTLPYDDRLFTGSNVQSVLASDDAQDIKDWLLLCTLLDIDEGRGQRVIPYPLPLGQAHCVCCRWSYPFSSAHAVLPSCSSNLSVHLTIGDLFSPPKLATSDVAYISLDTHPTGPLGSSVFIIQPGWKSIWCGL
jgi:hypothetical protein